MGRITITGTFTAQQLLELEAAGEMQLVPDPDKLPARADYSRPLPTPRPSSGQCTRGS